MHPAPLVQPLAGQVRTAGREIESLWRTRQTTVRSHRPEAIFRPAWAQFTGWVNPTVTLALNRGGTPLGQSSENSMAMPRTPRPAACDAASRWSAAPLLMKPTERLSSSAGTAHGSSGGCGVVCGSISAGTGRSRRGDARSAAVWSFVSPRLQTEPPALAGREHHSHPNERRSPAPDGDTGDDSSI